MRTKKEPSCIIDDLPDRRIGMSAEDHAGCPKCFPKVQHTPTPWKVTEIPSVGLDGKRSGQVTVTNSKGDSIAVIGSNSLEDAAYIVRAVNVHEELVSACKVARSLLLRTTLQDRKDTAVCNQLGEAIAKAEGK